jgi:flagellar P-ring protein precursor FlgI
MTTMRLARPGGLLLLFVLFAGAALEAPARAARVKELVDVEGVRGNGLTGIGLVVGLAGTGDDLSSVQTRRPLAAALRHLGTNVDPNEIRARNVALVMVTATLPPFARAGSKLDVVVSSAGTAKSLQGGTLLSTALAGPDGKIYALAQGPVATGGFIAEGGNGSQTKRNHPTVARIPAGATVERDAPSAVPTDCVTLLLREPDFTTATRIAQAIEKALGPDSARVRDPGTVIVRTTAAYRGRVVEMVAAIEALEAEPDASGRVVIDERTGAVVVGAHVTVGPAAIASGSITVRVSERQAISQPQPLASGVTATTQESAVDIDEGGGRMAAIKGVATVGDVAAALNALGLRPRDLMSIFQALKAAGALRAEIVVL